MAKNVHKLTSVEQSAGRVLVHAAQVVDGHDVNAAPGALLLESASIIAAGKPQEIGEIDSRSAARVTLPREVIMPALVNVHAHLDLTHIGPQPLQQHGFGGWVSMIRTNRAVHEQDIAASARAGAALSLAGGVAAVGDIAGMAAGRITTAPLQALHEAGLRGVSYLEVFGIGRGEANGLEAVAQVKELAHRHADHGVAQIGIQPHAPYSCSRSVYQRAAETGLPMATHLAETLEELDFISRGSGPLADILRSVGVWEERLSRGWGAHPVDHLADVLMTGPVVAAHVNYIDDAQVEVLARANTTVAYCPRASAYFGHVGHRYREMMQHGINVALGTDSIVCLDTPDRISVLDDLRLLSVRDGVSSQALLTMATINGARGLGIDDSLFQLSPGATAGIIAVPMGSDASASPLDSALRSGHAARWIVPPRSANVAALCPLP